MCNYNYISIIIKLHKNTKKTTNLETFNKPEMKDRVPTTLSRTNKIIFLSSMSKWYGGPVFWQIYITIFSYNLCCISFSLISVRWYLIMFVTWYDLLKNHENNLLSHLVSYKLIETSEIFCIWKMVNIIYSITSNHRETRVNVVALVNRF